MKDKILKDINVSFRLLKLEEVLVPNIIFHWTETH